MRALLLVAALFQAGVLAGAERVVRDIRVEAPGSYWVELATADLARRTDFGGVEVLGPDGEPVPSRVVVGDPSLRCVEARVVGVAREIGRWRIRISAPESLERHEELRFLVDRAVLAADCRLEASADGESWREIARADLFRLGDEPGLAQTSLEYPPTTDRELVLSWPDAGGEPTVRGAELCPPRGPAEARTLEGSVETLQPPEIGGARVRVGGLPLALRPTHLELSWTGGAPTSTAGFRLRQETEEGWRELARGRIPAGQETFRTELDQAGSYIFETYGFAPTGIVARWRVAPQRIYFEARDAGLHLLRVPARFGGEAIAPADDALRLDAGTARSEPLPLPVVPPGREIDAATAMRRWPILAPGASPGEPVLLELGPGAGRECAGLSSGERNCRVVVGGRSVPARAVRGSSAPAAPSAALAPSAGDGGRSAADLGALDGARQLLIRAPSELGPFERTVALVGRSDAPGTDREVTLDRQVWHCDERPPLPCELALTLIPGWPRNLRIQVEDGGSTPLGRLTSEAIEPRPKLLLTWGGPATELVLAPTSRELRLDETAFAALLELARPQPATLGEALERVPTALDRHGRLLLAIAVGAVAVGLLLLLRRLLSTGGVKG